MAKLTPEQRAELEQRLADDDAADDDDEVEISSGDRTFRGTWRRAQQVAESWGFRLTPEPKQEESPKAGKGDGGEVKRFAGRRIS